MILSSADMIATVINALAVLVGTAAGLLLRKNISPSFKTIVMTSSGVVTLVLGLQMAFEMPSAIAALFALLLGGFIGHALRIEDRVLSIGQRLGGREGGGEFAKGFLDASLLFCTGSMSIVGAIEAGTVGDYELILIKSIMDGFMAIVFAASYGKGVAASVVTILVYQGFFTLLGGWLEPVLGSDGIAAMSATGGLLLVFLALGLLDIRHIQTGNFLPALALAPVTQHLYLFLPL